MSHKDPEARRAYAAAYCAANKTRVTAYYAAYRAANKKRAAALKVKWAAANKDRVALYQASYRLANRGREVERAAAESAGLVDRYVARQLELPPAQCTPELLAAKREQLLFFRAYRDLIKTLKEITQCSNESSQSATRAS